jgi:glutamyl-tRNA reductase
MAAVEALTHGMVNKFLHPHMQAIKKAAREGDSARLDALCEAWSVHLRAQAGEYLEARPAAKAPEAEAAEDGQEKDRLEARR